jgi:plastocyanin
MVMNTKLRLALGGLLLAAVTVVGCGGSGSSYSSPTSPSPMPSPTPTPGGATLTITITGQNGSNSFAPNPSSIVAGQSVAFFNGDSIVLTATADNGAFNTGNIAPGSTSAPITISAAGTYGYHCSIHPTMVGTLNVTSQ